MSFDKHDLFRNAVPGFVFLTVFLSFYAVTGRLADISKGQETILGIVAGFPLGFIIQNLYRFCHNYLGERTRIDRDEATLIPHDMPNATSREKGHYVWFQLSLRDNAEWKDRIDFLYSYMHALGASILAIVLGLTTILVVKFSLVLTWWGHYVLLAAVWAVIAILLVFVKESVYENCLLSTRIILGDTWKQVNFTPLQSASKTPGPAKKQAIDIFENVTKIVTVLALLFAVGTYCFDLYLKNQVYMTTIRMAEKETKINLSLIDALQNWVSNVEKSGLSPTGRFSSYFLQEISKSHRDANIRELAMDILVDLEQCNRMMDTLMGSGLTIWPPDQLNEIKRMMAAIAKELKSIADPLEVKYQTLLKNLNAAEG